MNKLPNQRTDGTARLNNGSFRSEGSPSADRNRRGDRLQNRNPWLNTAAIDQHCFHCLGNSMALDLGGSILRHEADNDSANHRHHDDPRTKMIISGAVKGKNKAMIEDDIGKQADQIVKQIRDKACQKPDSGGQERN